MARVAGDDAVAKAVRGIETWQSLELDRWANAEAQVASLADDIAYLSHDVDDGLRAGLLSLAALEPVALAGPIAREVAKATAGRSDSRAIYEVTRRMITAMIADLVTTSRLNLAALGPASPEDIRAAGRATIAFSSGMQGDLKNLKAFLFANVYRHPRVTGVMQNAEIDPGRPVPPLCFEYRRSSRGVAAGGSRPRRQAPRPPRRRLRLGPDRPLRHRRASPPVCGDAGIAT